MRYMQKTNLTIEAQKKIIDRLKQMETLGQTEQVYITHLLCQTARGHHKALLEFLTTDKAVDEITDKHKVKRKSYLYKWRKRFCERYYDEIITKEADN